MTQTVLLGDIAEINPESVGRSYGYDSILYLDTSSVTENIFSELQLFSLKDAPSRAKRIVRDGDIVYSTVRPNLKHFGYIKDPAENMIASTGFAVIRAREGVDPSYLYYWLTSDERTEYLSAIADSQTSTFPAFNPSVLGKLKIELPDLGTQKKIADILGEIDEKIELNRQMNETLEQMGQALFRHYFIDNPETEGWEDVRVGDVAEVTDYVANGSFSSLKANVTLYDEPEYALFVRTTDFKGGFRGSLKYTDKKSYEFLKKSTLLGGEFIISNVGDTGTVFRPPVWLGKPMTLGSNAIMIKDSEYNNYLYQYFRSNEGQFAISNIVAGSAQPKFNKTEFRNLKIKRPDAVSLSEFNAQFRTIEEGVFSNIAQIQTLTALRDTLLPRLINGKVKV